MNKRKVFRELRSPKGRQFFLAIANDLHATLGLIPDGSDENLGEYLVKRLFPRTYIAAKELDKQTPAAAPAEQPLPPRITSDPVYPLRRTVSGAVADIRRKRRSRNNKK